MSLENWILTTMEVSTSASSGTGALKTTDGGGSAGVGGTSISTGVSSGAGGKLDLASLDPRARALPPNSARDLHPASRVHARARIELERAPLRPKPGDPERGVSQLDHEIPFRRRWQRRGDVPVKVAAAEPSGNRRAAVLVFLGRQHDRSQRRRVGDVRHSEGGVEDHHDLIARRPPAVGGRFEQRLEIEGREARIAFGDRPRSQNWPRISPSERAGDSRQKTNMPRPRDADGAAVSEAAGAPGASSRCNPRDSVMDPSTATCLP